MPDICMCEGTGCPLKEKCYRYTATPFEYAQTYFSVVPYKDGECEHFYEIVKFYKSRDIKKT